MPETIVFKGHTVALHNYDRLTTINSCPISSNGMWMWHPFFLVSAFGDAADTATVADVEEWIARNRSRLLSSEFSAFIKDSISGQWSVSFDNPPLSARVDFAEYMRSNRMFSADRIDITVVESDGRRTGQRMILIDDPSQQRDEHTIYKYVTSRMSNYLENGAAVQLCVTPIGDSEDNWRPSVGSRDFYTLKNYTYTPPAPEFLSMEKENHELFFGLELEVSTMLSPRELQRINTEVEPARPIWFYFKQDSSISGRYSNRIEIVTFPMTPKRMRTEFRILFKKLDGLASAKGMTMSHVFDLSNDLTNGLHIHVNKTAFVQSHRSDHGHKFRFLAAFNLWESTNLDFYQRISKRPTSIKDNRYCFIHPGLDGRTVARRLRDGPQQQERHAACHEGGATVEVRLFQGIPDLNHVLSSIEIVEAMFEYTQFAPRSSYNNRFAAEFTKWVHKARGYNRAKEVLAQCA